MIAKKRGVLLAVIKHEARKKTTSAPPRLVLRDSRSAVLSASSPHEGERCFLEKHTAKRTAAPFKCRSPTIVYTAEYSLGMPHRVTNRSGRDALRGSEARTLDLIFEILTSEQWAELLRAPLEHAAAKGVRDIAQELISAGASIGSALHKAVRGGHGNIAKDLLERGASIAAKDAGGDTPLHIAAQFGRTEMVQLLLLKGADTDVFDNEEWTPLSLAAYQGHLGAAQALLAAGADVGLRCSEMMFTVVHITAKRGRSNVLRAVIAHGADVNAVDGTDGSVALHYAASNNHAEAIDLLVEAGANIEAVNDHSLTPLHDASGGVSHEALLCLLKHGAIVNAQHSTLETPLMYAAAKAGIAGAVEVVDSLLRAGADETLVDDKGRKASDVIATSVDEEEDRLVEDVERVRELLANAPTDRAWRRRGYLVLCRAHSGRVQQTEDINGTCNTDTRRWTRSRAKLARARGIAQGRTTTESTEGDWAAVMVKVLRLQEEDLFRTIMRYL